MKQDTGETHEAINKNGSKTGCKGDNTHTRRTQIKIKQERN